MYCERTPAGCASDGSVEATGFGPRADSACPTDQDTCGIPHRGIGHEATALAVADASAPYSDDVRLSHLLSIGTIGTRTYHCLVAHRLLTVGDVRQRGVESILSLRNFGRVSLRELLSSGILVQTKVADGDREQSSLHSRTRSASPSAASLDLDAIDEANGTVGSHPDVSLSELYEAGVIGTRTHNCLVSQGITTVGEVRNHSVDALLKLRNFGKRSLEELMASGVLAPDGPYPHQREPHPLTSHRDAPGHGDDTTSHPGTRGPILPAAAKTPPVVHTLSELLGRIRDSAGGDEFEVVCQRETATLEEIARTRAITRERVRQIESKGLRLIMRVVRDFAPHMPTEWHRQLAEGIASEDSLFGPYMDATTDADTQLRTGRIVLRATLPTAAPLRAFGHRLTGYWENGHVDAQVAESIRELAEFGPYTDAELSEAISIHGLDDTLTRLILFEATGPIMYDRASRGWVRRVGTKRDACYLILTRAGRPASIEVLARMLDDNPRNLGAALERDERFQKLYGIRKWALASWDNGANGGRYRSTRDAVTDILTRNGPMPWAELVNQVTQVHHVTSWAVANNLEHEVFGQLPDGRYGMTFQGGISFAEQEPTMTADVDPPRGGCEISFYLPVTADLLRGSGIPIPRYVTWFAGLRRVPRKRTFDTATGGIITIRRNPGSSSISSLRQESQTLRLDKDCLLRINLNLADGTASVRPACPCHSQREH